MFLERAVFRATIIDVDNKHAIFDEEAQAAVLLYYFERCGKVGECLGILSGNIAVAVPTNTTEAELKDIYYEYNACLIIAPKTTLNKIAFDFEGTSFEELTQNSDAREPFDFPETNPDDACTVLFTSGTTGERKGVMLSQVNLLSNVIASCQMYEFRSSDVYLNVLPFYHSYGLTAALLIVLYTGGTICLGGGAKYLFRDLPIYKPTQLHLVPAMAKMLLKRIETDGVEKATGGNLRKILSGGAHTPAELSIGFRKHGIGLYGCYGITECSPAVCLNRDKFYKDGSVGMAVPCNEIKIADSGEVLVRGSNVMIG